jgi:hypothetical protein
MLSKWLLIEVFEALPVIPKHIYYPSTFTLKKKLQKFWLFEFFFNFFQFFPIVGAHGSSRATEGFLIVLLGFIFLSD